MNPPSDNGDDEYVDEDEKKAREEAKVQQLIREAEDKRPKSSHSRGTTFMREGSSLKDSTYPLVQTIETSVAKIDEQLSRLERRLREYDDRGSGGSVEDVTQDQSAEEVLSLTVSKEDFARMRIVGQFNLGFILATRTSSDGKDELFIIDQHAADEKFNFERLQETTVVQNQRLVKARVLDLTAIEEEIIMDSGPALEKNGFLISMDTSGDSAVGRRCRLLSLPMSREVVFDTRDLEELVALLSDGASSATDVPRPSKVRRMFAMRACRSSIMIGRTLTPRQMGDVVHHLGELEKPWNCPHGRPTMRHLFGLDVWEAQDRSRAGAGLGELRGALSASSSESRGGPGRR